MLEGTGRMRVGDETLTLTALSSALVAPSATRQVFSDTGAEQLWLIVGAPVEATNTLEMTADQLAWTYPDGPRALPEELGGGVFTPPE